jgi:hypothetical protein
MKHHTLSRLWTGIALAAAIAAGAVAAVLVLGNDASTSSAGVRAVVSGLPSAAADARRVPSIMALTPRRLAAGALGSGYALPTVDRGPTTATVLAAMSPRTRRYTKAIMSLTFRQLAAGAAGHP